MIGVCANTSPCGNSRPVFTRGAIRIALTILAQFAMVSAAASSALDQTTGRPAESAPATPPTSSNTTPRPQSSSGTPPTTMTLPPGYVIGPDDVLSVVFWKDPEMSRDVTVRPDGMISLPLINDIAAAGLTPEQLRVSLQAAASNYLEEPNAAVVVKQILSRKVYITGLVFKPGPYPLTVPTSVLQLISMAGGLRDFADKKNIVVLRIEKGQQLSYRFNYEDIVRSRNLRQNLELKPGDTVVVP